MQAKDTAFIMRNRKYSLKSSNFSRDYTYTLVIYFHYTLYIFNKNFNPMLSPQHLLIKINIFDNGKKDKVYLTRLWFSCVVLQ